MSEEVIKTNELIKALIEAESEYTKIELNKTGQVGNAKFKYADLTSVFNATKPALRKHGLKVIGVLGQNDNGDNVLTMTLMHVSGQSISSQVRFPSTISKSTELGAVLTYMRRYLYCTLLGVAGEEDVEGDNLDDCDKVIEAAPKEESRYISQGQWEALLEYDVPEMKDYKDQILKHYKIKDYTELLESEFQKVYKRVVQTFTERSKK
jgi:hypothetical protein